MEPPKKKIFYFDKDNLIIKEYQDFGTPVSVFLDGISKVLALRFPYDWMEFRRSRTPKCGAPIWPNLQEIGSELANPIGNRL
ncbi:hypothetical protein RIR_jg10448.t1 [Rhizophagus irregularis DAOM 181602=DAOM 197198]|nr:hypothetical protein RIR_jg10448.t1 [Rhizophagus irregularis DAOM 181602=DAOM 197198]